MLGWCQANERAIRRADPRRIRLELASLGGDRESVDDRSEAPGSEQGSLEVLVPSLAAQLVSRPEAFPTEAQAQPAQSDAGPADDRLLALELAPVLRSAGALASELRPGSQQAQVLAPMEPLDVALEDGQPMAQGLELAQEPVRRLLAQVQEAP